MKAWFFNGLQGSGKGKQGEFLEALSFKRVVASEALAEKEKNDLSYQQEVNGYISSGLLVPDEITVNAIKDYLQDRTTPMDNIVLDGCMRTAGQAEGMIQYLEDMGYSITVFLFVLPEETAVERALLRRRKDDTPEKLKVRFKGYYDHLGSVLATVVQRGYSIHVINTAGTPESIHLEICKITGLKTNIMVSTR